MHNCCAKKKVCGREVNEHLALPCEQRRHCHLRNMAKHIKCRMNIHSAAYAEKITWVNGYKMYLEAHFSESVMLLGSAGCSGLWGLSITANNGVHIYQKTLRRKFLLSQVTFKTLAYTVYTKNIVIIILNITSSTAQGRGGSFKTGNL